MSKASRRRAYSGVYPSNMSRLVFIACHGPNGFDTQLWQNLHSLITLGGLHDIVDAKDAAASWADAAQASAELPS